MSNEVESRPSVKQARSRKSPVRVEPPQVEEAPATVDAPSPAAQASPELDALLGKIEAVLLSVDRPVSGVRLAEALGLLDEAAADKLAESEEVGTGDTGKRRAAGSPLGQVRRAVDELNRQYQATGRAFRIESVAGGFRVMTLPVHAGVIETFLGKRERTSLSRAAVETLAIVAYKQPITRAALESVRGVACGEVLKTLMERRLVTITGRAEELGRPMLYGTTRQFLEAFGLSGLKDLPSAAEFKARHGGDPAEEAE